MTISSISRCTKQAGWVGLVTPPWVTGFCLFQMVVPHHNHVEEKIAESVYYLRFCPHGTHILSHYPVWPHCLLFLEWKEKVVQAAGFICKILNSGPCRSCSHLAVWLQKPLSSFSRARSSVVWVYCRTVTVAGNSSLWNPEKRLRCSWASQSLELEFGAKSKAAFC